MTTATQQSLAFIRKQFIERQIKTQSVKYSEFFMLGTIFSGGLSIFGLFTMNPALFAFLLIIAIFGGMNLIEFKRFD